MSLNAEPFELIKAGKKTIEVRLYDEKRKKVRPGDYIIFSKLPNKTVHIKVEVIGLSIFKSFKDLFSNLDKYRFGHNENLTIEDQIAKQRIHYSVEEEQANGVVGIHIKLHAQ